MRKITAWIICAIMLLTFLPVGAFAATEEEKERIREQISDVYSGSLSATGASSLHGYCGMLAGWELYLMGITDSAVTRNGNEMYDVLQVSDQIAQGYTPVCYAATDYTLEGALNTVSHYGSEDVYNIVVGFQWTVTAAGRYYGHVTVIHAILDGQVYFSEGFVTPFQSDPSQAMVCSIQEFAQYYDGLTCFEGLIHFDTGIAVAGCDTLACDLFVAGDTEVTLMTKPDFSEQYRTVPAGERLQATALCRNIDGVLFYQIPEGNSNYYVPAGQVVPVWFDDAQVGIKNCTFPEQVNAGTDSPIAGAVVSENLSVVAVAVSVVDSTEQTVFSLEISTEGKSADLKAVDELLDLSLLAEGSYTLRVFCDLENPYVSDGEIVNLIRRVPVSETVFSVGDVSPVSRSASASQMLPKNGWQYENDNWYYYEDGSVRTGWFCDNGVDYYLLSDGAAATGWQEINGKSRFISETGAMRTGWLETSEGVYYMLSNGEATIGSMVIDGSEHFFDENGFLTQVVPE